MITHERNTHIELDTDRHVYTYRGYKIFKGVTSWIAQYNEPFNAPLVARDLAKYRDESAQEILDSWERTRQYGDYVHEVIENYIKDGESLNVDELENFKKAMEEHDLTPIAAEMVIYDEDIERASAVDLICINHKNQYVVIDIKTRHKGIEAEAYKNKTMYAPLDNLPASRYFKYCLQVNIYKYWLEKKYDLDISPVNYILNLTDEDYELIPVVDLEGSVKKMYQQL